MSTPHHGRTRPTRRRGFDDAADEPAPLVIPRSGAAPAGFGPELGATVKWFNAEKGFGFAELADGSGDAFLHVNVLSASGHATVEPGATLRVRVAPGAKGKQISEVLSVDGGTAAPQPPRAASPYPAPRPGPRAASPAGPSIETQGVVKWYSAQKGFGFVAVPDGGRDVFVHVTAVQRSGLTDLAEGQPVVVGVVQGPKGPEAASIRLD